MPAIHGLVLKLTLELCSIVWMPRVLSAFARSCRTKTIVYINYVLCFAVKLLVTRCLCIAADRLTPFMLSAPRQHLHSAQKSCRLALLQPSELFVALPDQTAGAGGFKPLRTACSCVGGRAAHTKGICRRHLQCALCPPV